MIQAARILLRKLNVTALSLCLFVLGIIIHTNTFWRYRLVVRDEPRMMGAPASFTLCGVLFSIIMLCTIWFIVATQKRERGGEISAKRTSGADSLWGNALLCVTGMMSGTVGAGLLVNARFDKSVAQTHQAEITRMYTKRGPEGRREGRLSGYIRVTDWKGRQSEIELKVDDQIFDAHKIGEKINITTKSGFFGYE